MIKFRIPFLPPGVYPKDIKRYTGYADVVGACKKAGVVLYRLRHREYAPISLQDSYKVLQVIRSLQGKRFLTALTNNDTCKLNALGKKHSAR